jgi:hypothetical protein
MSAGPQPVAVFAIGVDYGRPEKPKPSRHHKPQRELWRPAKTVPRREVDRDLVERMRRAARDAVEAAKPTIEAMLAHGRLLLEAA